ncbi:MAG: NAD-dependent epimerase/dehydratase family protein [Polyangiales bacterium]
MRALITGGAGFIGSNLSRRLLDAGHEVVVMDNLVSTGSLRLLGDAARRVVFCHGDVRSAEDFARLPAGPYDRVFHLAASFANELSVEHPLLDLRTNVDGTLHALAFARRVGCGLFVYAGSSSVYGDIDPPFCEDAAVRPHTPYAASKLCGEVCTRTAGIPHAVYRLFNVYGPGDLPGRYRNAIPNLFREAAGADPCLRVYGAGASRDFTFVDDVVTTLCDALRAEGQVVNLGTGVETPIVDLAHAIARASDLPAQRVRVEPPRAWDRVARRCADITRLRALHGPAAVTPLAEGLARVQRWLAREGELGGAAP